MCDLPLKHFMTSLTIDIDDLVSRYASGESASSLAKLYECSVWSVITRLRNNGVRVRSPKEQNEKRLSLSPGDYTKFVQIVDGLLLGDGSINHKNCLYLTQTSSRQQWVLYVRGILAEVGAYSTLMWRGPREHVLEGRAITEKASVLLYSPAYVEMARQRKRWYPLGAKRVPLDVRITPVSVAHWFAGDGTYDKSGALFFCTNGFLEEDTAMLADKLSCVVGINAIISRTSRVGQFKIAVHRKNDSVRLRDFMLPWVPVSVRYKLKYVRPTTNKERSRFSDSQVEEIRSRRALGEKLKTISEDFGVSASVVGRIAAGKLYKRVSMSPGKTGDS